MIDLGSCACDLTDGLCDGNCCCDPDCPDPSMLFSRCLPDNVGLLDRPTDGYPTTYLPDNLQSVSTQGLVCPNPIYADPFSGYGWCVVFSNSAAKGLFFPETKAASFFVDSSAFSSEYKQSKGYTFGDDGATTGSHFTRSIFSDNAYGFGSQLQALIDPTTSTKGFWTLPAALEESSECQETGMQGRKCTKY